MKAILVDDEALALSSMEKVLKEIGEVKIVGMYQDPLQVAGAVTMLKPDVIFLDIEMPGLNGMMLAEQLMQTDPRLNIVFVTAYNEYAVEAFELAAVDYILKPIRHDRVANTLQRLRDKHMVESDRMVVGSTMIRCFRSIQIEFAGQEPELIPWRTNKAQELFAYLLYRSGIQVRKDVLIDILWPDLSVTKAYSLLYTTMYQLRKTLAALHLDIKITSGDEGYMLDKGDIRVDTELWENSLRLITRITAENVEELRSTMKLYRGSYLQEYDYEWAIENRERLHMIWFQQAIDIADYLRGAKRYTETIALCLEIRERQPYSSYSYFMLMKIHAELGDRATVRNQYNQLIDVLKNDLGESPEPHIQVWYKNWEY